MSKTIKIPEYLPEYKIEKTNEKPFSIKWEELLGWFLVPKIGEHICWGIYDLPSRRCDYVYDMKVLGKAEVHGIEGVEISADEFQYSKPELVNQRGFIAQLTDTHCRYLASSYRENSLHKFITFLDGEAFDMNWGYGEDNCGNETNVASKGIIQKEGNIISFKEQPYLMDIVGRYELTIKGKTYDTVCLIDINAYNDGVLSEQFLDRNGRTILWRRFNRNDWHFNHYQKLWTEMLSENERYTANSQTYVHWYDCISDYIL